MKKKIKKLNKCSICLPVYRMNCKNYKRKSRKDVRCELQKEGV